MPRSANRTVYPVETPRTSVQTLYATLTGAGTGELTMSTQEALNGEIATSVRSDVGKHTFTSRYLYPQLKANPVFSFVGTTDGLVGQCSAVNMAAGTFAVEFYVGSTPTDLATTDTVTMSWVVRNSGKNS